MRKTVTTIGGMDDIDCCLLGVDDESSGLGNIGENEDDPLFEDVVSDVDPTFVPNTPEAQAIPEPGPGGSLTLKGKGWSLGDGTYIVQSGDTLAGLSRLYLGDAGRYQEIWSVQSSQYRSVRTPDRINVGDRLAMPAEAVANAKRLGVFPSSSSSTSPMGTSSPPPAKTTPAPSSSTAPPKTTPPATTSKTTIGLVAAALGAGLFLFAKPVPPPPPPQPQRRRRR